MAKLYLYSSKKINDFDTINSGLAALEAADFKRLKPRALLRGQRLLDELNVWKKALQLETLKTEYSQK